MSKNKYLILFLLLAAFLLVKIPVILTSIYKIFDLKELYIGTVAKELIEGSKFALFDYQLRYNVGGSLVLGILVVPFFLLFGQSYFVLKLFALSYSAATFMLWYMFLARFFNKRVALFASFFFIFPPPFYAKFSLMSYGKHGESNLFTVICLLVFFRLFFENPKGPDRKSDYALFGLLSGFAMYFDPIFFTTLAACFLFWFIFDKRFILKRSFLVFFISFLIGFSPWIYYHASRGFQTVCLNDRYPEPALTMQELFRPNFFVAVFNNLKSLTVFYLPRSSCFANFWNIPGQAIGDGYYLIYVLAFCVLAWLSRKFIFRLMSGASSLNQPYPITREATKEIFILAYSVIHLLVLSVIPYAIDYTDHDLYGFYGYRRLLPLYPFMFAITALFLDKLLRWKKPAWLRPFFYLLITFFILSGLIANYGLVTPSNFGNHLIYEGYNYYEFGKSAGRQAGGDISKAVYLANNIQEPYRPLFFEGIGIYWGYMFYKKQPLPPRCIAEIRTIDPRYRPYALRGVGISIGADCWDDMSRADRDINRIDKESRPYVYEGLGEWIGLIWGHKPEFCISLANKIKLRYRPDYYRGLGMMVGVKFGQNIAYYIGLAQKIDPGYRCYYFEGLSRHLGWRYKYYLKKEYPDGLIYRLPAECRDFFISRLRAPEGSL